MVLGQWTDEEGIKTTLKGYLKYAKARGGAEASKFVDAETIAWYDDIVGLARTAKKKEVKALPISQQLVMFLVRMRLNKGQIMRMNGKSLFVFGINEGWLGNNLTEPKLGKIKIDSSGKRAMVEMFEENGEVSDTKMVFTKEGEDWKLNFVSLLEMMDVEFARQAEEMGATPTNFILFVLKMMGEDIEDKKIWKPVQKW